MKKTYIIAEAGVNHNGDINLAKKLADVAKCAGADAVKYQTFIAEDCISNKAVKAQYQIDGTKNNESQLDMVRKLQLTFDEFDEIKAYCDEIKIQFLSTPFDFKSIDFLNKLDLPFWKIPSGEITNVPYLIRVAQTGKSIIMSTGMCLMNEVEFAVNILKNNGAGTIALLHCNTEYPTPYEDVNLEAMITLKQKFNCKIGYSDHTLGIEIPIAAVALGAEIIEKHFTLDKKMSGPDHRASLESKELAEMINAIRNVEKAIGNGEKMPTKSELKNISIARKSIVAKTNIKSGDIFTDENITVKRPGDGISPVEWFDVIGKMANRSFEKDELIEL